MQGGVTDTVFIMALNFSRAPHGMLNKLIG